MAFAPFTRSAGASSDDTRKKKRAQLQEMHERAMRFRKEGEDKRQKNKEVIKEHKIIDGKRADDVLQEEARIEEMLHEDIVVWEAREKQAHKDIEDMKHRKEQLQKKEEERRKIEAERISKQHKYMASMEESNQAILQAQALKTAAIEEADEARKEADRELTLIRTNATREAFVEQRKVDTEARKQRGAVDIEEHHLIEEIQHQRKAEYAKIDAWIRGEEMALEQEMRRKRMNVHSIPQPSERSKQERLLETDERALKTKIHKEEQRRRTQLEVDTRKQENEIKMAMRKRRDLIDHNAKEAIHIIDFRRLQLLQDAQRANTEKKAQINKTKKDKLDKVQIIEHGGNAKA